MVTAVTKAERTLMNIMATALQRISTWMEEQGLQLMLEKANAVLLTTRRKMRRIIFNIQETTITPSKAIKVPRSVAERKAHVS
ncbi:hypothetical protein Trydic_g21625 [Trypoxylus dichotomus]